MRHIPLPLLNGLITRSGFEPSFLRMDLYCEVRLGLVTCGGWFGIRFWVCLRNSVSLVEFGSEGIQVQLTSADSYKMREVEGVETVELVLVGRLLSMGGESILLPEWRSVGGGFNGTGESDVWVVRVVT